MGLLHNVTFVPLPFFMLFLHTPGVNAGTRKSAGSANMMHDKVGLTCTHEKCELDDLGTRFGVSVRQF